MAGRDLYGISAIGGLYRVDSSTLNADPSGNNPSIAAYVKGSQSLQGLLDSIGPGVSFTGLRAGPMFVEDGAYRQVLFGTTSNGQMHAFTNEGDLLNVFANGRASVDTGVVGVGVSISARSTITFGTSRKIGEIILVMVSQVPSMVPEALKPVEAVWPSVTFGQTLSISIRMLRSLARHPMR